MPQYIDIHGHVNFPEYDADRAEVIARARVAGVGMINVGTDISMSRSAIELARTTANMWATVGIHPTEIAPPEDLETLGQLAKDPKVVAIGECGLDYFHGKPEDAAAQRELFIRQIGIANEAGKPLMLHVRNGKTDGNAYQQAVDILKQYAKVRANFHFFAGSMDDLKAILDIDGTVSFTGVITFARDYDELIRYVPRTHIMSETDCPYVSPAPYRGKRNEPSYVVEVVRAIASIRGGEASQIAEQLRDNAALFFGL